MVHERLAVSTIGRRLAAIDLGIVLAVFLAVNVSLKFLDPVLRRGSGLSGVFTLAAYQFTLEGLAVFVVMAQRRERFSDYGFISANFWKSLGFGSVLAVLYDGLLTWNAGAILWIPFRRHSAVRMSLAAGLPSSVVGIAVAVFVWGFVEGFFGIFFARKINQILNSAGRGWLSPGVITFGLFNGAIHLAIGQGWRGFLFSFLSGYAITVVPAVTKNAWGGTLVQGLTNAVGAL